MLKIIHLDVTHEYNDSPLELTDCIARSTGFDTGFMKNYQKYFLIRESVSQDNVHHILRIN